jgi:hypothetical protein
MSNAAEKSRALFILRGLVTVKSHPYERDPHSGAGNCWCGRHLTHPIHGGAE